jgi:hypothetical protein
MTMDIRQANTRLSTGAGRGRSIDFLFTSRGRSYNVSSSRVVRQIVVHHIKRISSSLAEVLRFGIAC